MHRCHGGRPEPGVKRLLGVQSGSAASLPGRESGRRAAVPAPFTPDTVTCQFFFFFGQIWNFTDSRRFYVLQRLFNQSHSSTTFFSSLVRLCESFPFILFFFFKSIVLEDALLIRKRNKQKGFCFLLPSAVRSSPNPLLPGAVHSRISRGQSWPGQRLRSSAPDQSGRACSSTLSAACLMFCTEVYLSQCRSLHFGFRVRSQSSGSPPVWLRPLDDVRPALIGA